MTDTNIYKTINERCGGNIYIGVVGPVRTGKSTFIRKFLDCMVLPNIDNDYDRERTQDEIPQSGSGKTITTTEPKFTPSDAVRISLGGTALSAKVIDCVGYMIDGASGAIEEGNERMVMTPWSSEAMPFSKASEIGTEKVVKEHSTIALLVTTDGSICGIPRENYVPAEERAATELKESGVPFSIILNSATPESENAHVLAESLEKKYGVPVALINCEKLNVEDSAAILSLVVGEFPVRELNFELPEWLCALPEGHKIICDVKEEINAYSAKVKKLCDVDKNIKEFNKIEKISFDAASGCGCFSIPLPTKVYYSAIEELTHVKISGERDLFERLMEFAKIKEDYDKIKEALNEARECGYGIVMPSYEEIQLSQPELQKQAAGYGIRVCAKAESYHIIRTDLMADICPVVGSEEQSEEVIKNMNTEFEEDPRKLLDTKLFGRSLYDLVKDGMNAKLTHMPNEARGKLSKTLERIMNEGADGLICILL